MALERSVPVVAIQGPPGTGKTSVVVEIISRAAARGERVLAAAPTNAAVDNLVERLAAAGLKIVRVGNPARVAPAVASRSLTFQVERRLVSVRRDLARRRADLREDLRQCQGDESLAAGLRQMLKALRRMLKQQERYAVAEILASAEVVLCTNAGAGEAVVKSLPTFDLAIVDEAGQATEPSSWIPILRAKRAVLAGDPAQLAPTILSREALVGGLGVSLLERAMCLHGGALYCLLSTQYRMHEAIAGWASAESYGGVLASAPSVATRLLTDMTGVSATSATRAPLLLLDTRLPRGALLSGCEETLDPSGGDSLVNEGEAEIVVSHVRALLSAGVAAEKIAVQSPYLAQVQLLREQLGEVAGAEQVEVASVDSFQGREADAVVISMVRSNANGAVGFLSDVRRMNVAVTRARCHVAIVCDSATVSRNPFLLRFLQHVRREGEVRQASVWVKQQLQQNPWPPAETDAQALAHHRTSPRLMTLTR